MLNNVMYQDSSIGDSLVHDVLLCEKVDSICLNTYVVLKAVILKDSV